MKSGTRNALPDNVILYSPTKLAEFQHKASSHVPDTSPVMYGEVSLVLAPVIAAREEGIKINKVGLSWAKLSTA